jgi:hypothetical protein
LMDSDWAFSKICFDPYFQFILITVGQIREKNCIMAGISISFLYY